jgi:hypothetical protein
MKRVYVREGDDGRFSLVGFGVEYAGRDGTLPFRLVVESRNRELHLEFPETRLFDLFTTFDLGDLDFLANRYLSGDFLRVSFEKSECVVEARSGTLYDFFKERVASGECQLLAPQPVAFYWNGNSDNEAA